MRLIGIDCSVNRRTLALPLGSWTVMFMFTGSKLVSRNRGRS